MNKSFDKAYEEAEEASLVDQPRLKRKVLNLDDLITSKLPRGKPTRHLKGKTFSFRGKPPEHLNLDYRVKSKREGPKIWPMSNN